MDKILLNKYVGELSKENEKMFFNMLLAKSEKKVEYKDRVNYIYSPNKDLELILEATKEEKKLNISNIDLHVESDSVWSFELLKELKIVENSYLVNDTQGRGAYLLRIVNGNCLGDKLKEGEKLEGKMVGFVLAANIYKDEEEFQKTLPKKEKGVAAMTQNGAMMPIHLVNNHGDSKGNLNLDEKLNADDLLITVKGILRDVEKMDLRIENNEFAPYFKAKIDTAFGPLPIVFNARTLSPDVKGFNPGFIIVAEILLSADVCTEKYQQYKHKSDYLETIKEYEAKDKEKVTEKKDTKKSNKKSDKKKEK